MIRILCYGDSNTFGWDAASQMRFDETKRWPMLLQAQLGFKYYVTEEGLGGRTSIFDDPDEPGRNGSKWLIPCLQSHQPLDWVILMLGTNDMKRKFNPSLEMIRNGIECLINQIKDPLVWDDHKPAEILLVSPIYIRHERMNNSLRECFDERSMKISKEISHAYNEVASKYCCKFLDAAHHATASDIDGVHLDQEGHASLAKAIEKEIFCKGV